MQETTRFTASAADRLAELLVQQTRPVTSAGAGRRSGKQQLEQIRVAISCLPVSDPFIRVVFFSGAQVAEHPREDSPASLQDSAAAQTRLSSERSSILDPFNVYVMLTSLEMSLRKEGFCEFTS